MPSQSEKRNEVARQLLTDGGCVSVQVLNEFVHVCRRKANLNWEEIQAALEVIAQLCGEALPMTAKHQEVAVAIARRYGFTIYDAMILAVAGQANCSIVYSEDLQNGQFIKAMKVVNPFLSLV